MVEAARADLEPAGPDAINSAVRDVLSGLPSQKMGDGDAQSALLVYRIGLKDVPLDLLRAACIRAVKECEWRPPPKVLLDFVADEMAERRRRLSRLEDAKRRPPKPPVIISEAERAAVIDGLGELKAKLDAEIRADMAAQAAKAQSAGGVAGAVGNGSRAVVEAALKAAKENPPVH